MGNVLSHWFLSLEFAYTLIALLLLWLARSLFRSSPERTLQQRGFAALFWSLWAVLFLLGSYLPSECLGGILVCAALLSPWAKSSTQSPQQRLQSEAEQAENLHHKARELGFLASGVQLEQHGRGVVTVASRASNPLHAGLAAADVAGFGQVLLRPALLLPLLVMLGFGALKLANHFGLSFDSKLAPLLALQYAALLSIVYACWRLRYPPSRAVAGAAALSAQLGWPVLLPLMLAVLGAVFVKAGVGSALSTLLGTVIPNQDRTVCLLSFIASMVLLSMLLGNAFAAFPIAMAAIGMPWVVNLHGGDPIALSSIGMLCGYCGTLMSPMAANFNTVPAVLMQIEPRRMVIYAQLPSALWILLLNTVLLFAVVFR